jgi:hypothetical protein
MSNNVFLVGTEDEWAKVVYRFFNNDAVDHELEGIVMQKVGPEITTKVLTQTPEYRIDHYIAGRPLLYHELRTYGQDIAREVRKVHDLSPELMPLYKQSSMEEFFSTDGWISKYLHDVRNQISP